MFSGIFGFNLRQFLPYDFCYPVAPVLLIQQLEHLI